MGLTLAAEDIPNLSAQLKPQFHITPEVRIQNPKLMQLCSVGVCTLPDLALFLNRCDNKVPARSGS